MTKQTFAQIFIDSGKGFNEKESIRSDISYGQVTIEFDLKKYKSITNLRLDPVNDKSVIKNLQITAIDTKGKSSEITVKNSNANWSERSTNFIFLGPDPNIFLDIKGLNVISSLKVQFDYFSDGAILEDFGHKLLDSKPGSVAYIFDNITKLIRTVNSKVIGIEAEVKFQKSLSEKSNDEMIALVKLLEQNVQLQNEQVEFLTKQLKQLQDLSIQKDKEKRELEKNLDEIKNFTKDKVKFDELMKEMMELKNKNVELNTEIKNHIKNYDKLSKEFDKTKIELNESLKQNENISAHLEIRKGIEKQQDKELKLLHLDIKNLEKVSIKSITRLETQNIELKEQLRSSSKRYKSLDRNYRKQLVANSKLEEQIKDLQAISQQYSKLIEEIEHIVQD